MALEDTSVPRERWFQAEGLRITALHWGHPEAMPVLALHGWLDNAASFERLGPLLGSSAQLLALDLPGHGHSDHRPASGSYNLWDDLRVVLAVADAMGWRQFALLGHSRGAMMATLLAAASAGRVASLVCLDGFLPLPVSPTDAPGQLGDYLHDYRELADRPPRAYADREKMIKARCRTMGLSVEAASSIVARGTQQRDGHVYWRHDARLKGASAFKLTGAHCRAFHDALSMPVLVITAARGMGASAEWLRELHASERLQVAEFGGVHHQHLEQEEAEAVAVRISDFLKTTQCNTGEERP